MAYQLTEHVTAVTVSVKDKLTLSLGVAVGSSIVGVCPYHQHVLSLTSYLKQIALFVIPYVFLIVGHHNVRLISFPQFYHNSGVDPRQTLNSPFRSIRVCSSLPRGLDSSLSARHRTLMSFP